MVVQKLTLDEWFLTYQLAQIKKKAFHLPSIVRVDVSRLADFFSQSKTKLPLNAIILLGVGIWAEQNPQAHKMLFHTFVGPRFLFGDEVRINFPIQLQEKDRLITSFVVFKSPQKKTWKVLHDEIREHLKQGLKKLPVTSFVLRRSNHLFNRCALRMLYWLLMKLPGFYWKRGGGCLSVSSLSHIPTHNLNLTTLAFGPTGFTFCYNSIEQVGDQSFLNLGVGLDHNCYPGAEAGKLLVALAEILKAQDDVIFSRLTRSV